MIRRVLACALLGSSLWLAGACGGEDGGEVAGTGGIVGVGGASGSAGTAGAAASGGFINTDASADCPGGCDGGVCLNGSCCPIQSVCDTACCSAGDVCSFGKCETPGKECIDATECAPGEICDYSLGNPAPDGGTADAGADAGSCQGGATLRTGKCLPKPPECPTGVTPKPGEPITCLPVCEYKPAVGTFDPVLKAHWNKGNIMMAPIVIQLDDDNCDGVVDDRDIPEVVFSTFLTNKYNENGTLWAVSLVDGKLVEKWSKNPQTDAVQPGRSLAAGNIDGVPGNEVVACTATGKVRAFKADGSDLWTSDAGGCFMPSIGDLDGDGSPEVVVESRVLDGKTGATKATLVPANSANIVLSDMTGDGKLDIVTPSRLYKADGTLIADTALAGTYHAIGDFDKDGKAEVASIDKPNHLLNVWHYDAAAAGNFKVLRTGIDINGTAPNICPSGSSGFTTGGGPPTVGDFNGDGTADVAVAGGIGYTVLDGAKLLNTAIPPNQTNLWLKETKDCSSAATGSSIFDFEGDGLAEAVYSDEHYFRIYRGTDGTELWKTCNTTGTLYEYPLVADVDADGQADIVVISNDYSSITCEGIKTKGLRIYGDDKGNWVRTRRIWNQHAYHVTNVNDDGSIPTNEAKNWTQPRLNNFRQNVQPLGEFSAPDLIVSLVPRCTSGYELVATVRNIGQASVPPGVVVGFYENDPAAGGTQLGVSTTTKTLYPAEAEEVVLSLASPPASVTSGSSKLYAVVDDGSPPHAWVECRTDNNKSEGVSGECSSVPR